MFSSLFLFTLLATQKCHNIGGGADRLKNLNHVVNLNNNNSNASNNNLQLNFLNLNATTASSSSAAGLVSGLSTSAGSTTNAQYRFQSPPNSLWLPNKFTTTTGGGGSGGSGSSSSAVAPGSGADRRTSLAKQQTRKLEKASLLPLSTSSNSFLLQQHPRPVVATLGGAGSPYNGGIPSSPSSSTTATALQILAEADLHLQEQQQQRQREQRPRKEDRELSQLVEAEGEHDEDEDPHPCPDNLHLILLKPGSPSHYGGDLLSATTSHPPATTSSNHLRTQARTAAKAAREEEDEDADLRLRIIESELEADLAATSNTASTAQAPSQPQVHAEDISLSPMRHSPLYSATGLPGTASRYSYQSPVSSSQRDLREQLLLPPPARTTYIPTPTPQPPPSHHSHILHASAAGRPVFSRSQSVPENSLLFDSEDEELLLLEAAATASHHAPSPTYTAAVSAYDDHLLNPLREPSTPIGLLHASATDPLLSGPRPSSSLHSHSRLGHHAYTDPLLQGLHDRRPLSRRSNASDRLIRNPFAGSLDLSSSAVTERYLRLNRYSRSSDLPTTASHAGQHHLTTSLGAKLEAAAQATRRLTDRQRDRNSATAASVAATERRAQRAALASTGAPLTLGRSLQLVTENATRRAQAEQRKKSVRFGAEDLNWISLLGAAAGDYGLGGLGLEEDAWMTVEDVRSGRWARWDALCKQESQDSQTRDSGIETGSCFTSSEDSNRGSAADHHHHHYYHHHSRKVRTNKRERLFVEYNLIFNQHLSTTPYYTCRHKPIHITNNCYSLSTYLSDLTHPN